MAVDTGGVNTTVALAQANAAQGAKVLKKVGDKLNGGSGTSSTENSQTTGSKSSQNPNLQTEQFGSGPSATDLATNLKSQLAERAAQISTKVM